MDGKMLKIVENKKKFYAISLLIIITAVCFAGFNLSTGKGAFNLDVDFSGGTSLTYYLGEDAETADVQAIIAEAAGISSPRVQRILGTTSFTVQMRKLNGEERAGITEALRNRYPETELMGFADVSSTVSGEMQRKAITAVLASCIAMLAYITIRFKDLKMGASAIAALSHDVLVMLAVYIIFRVPINNSFIAAILTILGYSINATIVVFDRIRENKKFVKRHETEHLINSSVTQTLARSINTSLTTLIAITCVYFYGVTSVREFAFPLIIGILCGAYSSVCFAGSVWHTLISRPAK